MKKQIISGIMIAGAIAVAAGFAGCSSPKSVTKDTLLDKSLDTFTEMKSVDADVNLDMEMTMGSKGFSMEMKNKADMNCVGVKDGVTHVKGTVEMLALGQEQNMEVESYTEKEGTQLVQYSKASTPDSEGTWSLNRVDTSSAGSTSEMSVAQIAKAYSKLKESLSDLSLSEEKVSYNNTECYVVSGTITGDKLIEMMQAYGQELPTDSQENMELIDIDTKLYFKTSDETPYAVEMDVAEAMKNIMAARAEAAGGMEIEAKAMNFSMIFNSFDSVTDLTVPEDVKANAVEGIDTVDIQNMLTGGI